MLPSSIVSSNNLRVASDIPYPPWEYYDPATSKNPAGFDYDISQAIGKKIGIPTSFNETPFDSIILSIKGGKNDMIMSSMADTVERQQSGVSFVDYAHNGTAFLVLKGNPEGVSNIDSLSGRIVASENGTTQQAFLQTWNTQLQAAGKKPITVLALPNEPGALLAVKSGRAVAVVQDLSVLAYIAQTTNNGNTFEVVTDPASPNGYYPSTDGIGIVASNTALITTVQKALQALIDGGAYQRIVAKYGLLTVTSAQVNQGPPPTPSASSTP
jgi:polar amino acid transport system substrate-binding protein